jgi:hypothetical protein
MRCSSNTKTYIYLLQVKFKIRPKIRHKYSLSRKQQQGNIQPIIKSRAISILTVILLRDGIDQILVGISSSPMAVLVQFSGRLLISVVGSKIENKFLITFN